MKNPDRNISRFSGMTPAERSNTLKEEFAETGVMPEEYHGKTYGVTIYKCDCPECAEVSARIKKKKSEYADKRREALTPDQHGTSVGALTAVCDCVKCKHYRAEYRRQRRNTVN